MNEEVYEQFRKDSIKLEELKKEIKKMNRCPSKLRLMSILQESKIISPNSKSVVGKKE